MGIPSMVLIKEVWGVATRTIKMMMEYQMFRILISFEKLGLQWMSHTVQVKTR